jgi:hypothetical protein
VADRVTPAELKQNIVAAGGHTLSDQPCAACAKEAGRCTVRACVLLRCIQGGTADCEDLAQLLAEWSEAYTFGKVSPVPIANSTDTAKHYATLMLYILDSTRRLGIPYKQLLTEAFTRLLELRENGK